MREKEEANWHWGCRSMAQHCGGKDEILVCKVLDFEIQFYQCCDGIVAPLPCFCCQSLIISDFLLDFVAFDGKREIIGKKGLSAGIYKFLACQ